MTDLERGGTKTLAPIPTKEALKIEMQRAGCKTATEDGFRTAKVQIAKFTGRHFDRHFQSDPSKSLKVLKTIMMLKEHSFQKMFEFLTPPADTDSGSLEVADSHPLQDEKAIERVALLADLKAHLSLEIPEWRCEEIDSVFEPMRERVNDVVAAIQREAGRHVQGDYERFRQHLAAASEMLRNLSEVDLSSPALLPLDEHMYIHCSSLEFLNYAVAQKPIYRDHSPKLNLSKVRIRCEGFGSDGNRTELHIDEFEAFAKDNKQTLMVALNRALPYDVDPAYFDEVVPLAKTLLRLSHAYHSAFGAHKLEIGFSFDPTAGLAALAAVFHQKHHPTKGFKPTWHGRKNISGSVIAALQSYELSPDAKDNVVPEAFTRFWDHQHQWFIHGLMGGAPIYELKLALNQQLIDGLVPFVRHHDTALLVKRLAEYDSLPGKVAELLSPAEKTPGARPDYRPKPRY